jgi:hypothetical protein
MTVGSVRGNERFEMPVRVAHGGRGAELVSMADARSAGGHVRLKPPLTERVRWPQLAQKGLRLFQSRTWRAAA